MSVVGNVSPGGKEKSFWKKNIKCLPGSILPACPEQDDTSLNSRKSSSVSVRQDNEGGAHIISQNSSDQFASVETFDDDLLLDNCAVKLSRHAVQSAAVKVLESHSEQLKMANVYSTATEIDTRETAHLEKGADANSALGLLNSQKSFGPGVGIRISRLQHIEESSRLCSTASYELEHVKEDKFSSVLSASSVNLDELRKLSWSGVPAKYRSLTWKLLCGYVSPIEDRRIAMLERKRLEYRNFVDQYYSTRHQDIYQETYRQIHIDIPRMSPLIPLFQQRVVQEVFERILYIWAIRHPASGYVQGINDLVTPFFVVFLLEYLEEGSAVESCQIKTLSTDDLEKLEADCFWCFSKLLDGIQDNYTFAQPGIQIRVNSLKELVSRIDYNLHHHLELMNIEYLQFAFRWMNNLLMREIPLRCVIRLWDTYLSESNGFASFHLYVCVAFLIHFSVELQQEKDFHTLLVMLQNLPTEHWTDEEVGVVLADAYRLKYIFADAPKHLQ